MSCPALGPPLRTGTSPVSIKPPPLPSPETLSRAVRVYLQKPGWDVYPTYSKLAPEALSVAPRIGLHRFPGGDYWVITGDGDHWLYAQLACEQESRLTLEGEWLALSGAQQPTRTRID